MNIDIIVSSSNQDEFDTSYIREQLSEHTLHISKCCYEKKSKDEDKVIELANVLRNDHEIILALRGGAGATRLMNDIANLEFEVKNKTLIGYSDLTVLLNYFSKYENMTLIHGPMAFELKDELAISKFKGALTKSDVKFAKKAKWYNQKELIGEVVGGNLTLIAGMMGTFYELDVERKILLIEEIDEPLDKLDRMFAQLRDSGKLTSLSGIVLGTFTKCVSNDELISLFDQYLSDLDVGILYDVNLGHVKHSDYIHLYTKLTIDEAGIKYLK